MKKTLFSIPDQNDYSPMINSHYYNYLLSNKENNVHGFLTKVTYIRTLGFDTDKHTLSSDDIFRLQAIEQHYTINELYPKWEKEIQKYFK